MKKTFLNILASVVIFCFLGFFLFTIYSGLLSTETGGKICFWYLVARFVLKRITK